MTIKEFSEKYGVSYNMAYQASHEVEPVGSMIRDKDFPEDGLYHATMRLINDRLHSLSDKVCELQKLRSMVKWRRMEG